MAFRVLRERERAFLDEEERKAYEEAYSIYLERAAFVKRLEELDKVKLPHIVLNKKPVKKIKAPEPKKGKLPEYSASVSKSGSDFLNAAKNAGMVFVSVGKIKPASGFYVSLPEVKTNAPEISAVDPAISYKAELLQVSVPTVPKTGQIEKSEFIAELPTIKTDYEPYSKDVNIKPYSVVPTDSVHVVPPDVVPFKSEGKRTAVLPEIKLCVPDTVKVGLPPIKDIKVDRLKTVVPDVIRTIPDKTVVSQCSAFTANAPKIECTVPQRDGVYLPKVMLSAAPEVSVDIPHTDPQLTSFAVVMPQAKSVSNKITAVQADLSSFNAVLPKASEISNNVPNAKADISSYISTLPAPGKVSCNINVSKTELGTPKSIAAPKVSVNISTHALDVPPPSFVPDVPKPATFTKQSFEVKQIVLPKIQIPVIDRSNLEHILPGI